MLRKVVALLGLAFILASIFAIPNLPFYSKDETNQYLKGTSNAAHSAAISEEGENSGVGKNLTAFEYAQSTNSSLAVNLPNNQSGTYKQVSIDTPPDWTGYKLFTDVTGLTDNCSWLVDGNLATLSPWFYTEYDLQDYNNGTPILNVQENSWGWYGNNPLTPGGSGALCLNHGYRKQANQPIGDPQDSREFCAFNQTVFMDRGSVSAVKVIFNLYKQVVNTTYGTGWDTVFISINGFRADFHVFDSSYSVGTWYQIEYDLPALEIPKFFNTPGNLMFQIGIHQQTSGCYWESATAYRDAVMIDDISLYIQAAAKPSQVQLKVNGTSIQDSGYGAGKVNLTTPCPNPSSVSYLPTWANFSIGWSTDVKLTTSLTQYVNHTKFTTVYSGGYGTDFSIKNNTNCNWTGYFYASTPNLHSQYNFSIFYPTNWTPWAVFDPSPINVFSQITIGIGNFSVGAARANDFPGLWRMEFNAPNFVGGVTSYRNSTSGPTTWVADDGLLVGDYLNITAQINGSESVTNTYAQLEVRFPNGTMWAEHSQEKPVDANRLVYFDYFRIPEGDPNYVAGDYTVFVTWNNSRGATQCNETGIFSKVIAVKHPTQLTPDEALMVGIINGTTQKIRVTYNDTLTGALISGASVSFLNFGGSIQNMMEIAPGYYSADLLVAVPGTSGFYNITVNATHRHFSLVWVNITLDVILDTTLTSNIYPTVAVQSNANFTVDLTYRQKTTGTAIDGATILLDYDPNWELTLVPQGAGTGIYVLTGNNSQFSANTIQKIDISAQKAGYETQNISLNIKITPRTAVFQTIYMNGTNNTLVPSYRMPITTWLNLSVQLCDELEGTPLFGLAVNDVNITGVNATPSPLTPVGNYYEILLNSSALGKGVHFLTLVGNATNYVLATSVIQVSVEQVATLVHTDDYKTTYSREQDKEFTFKIRIDDLDFGGNITAYNISYEWRYGRGNLTGPDAEGFFTITLPDLPKGTWTITIRVEGTGSDYAFEDLLITLIVTEPVVEGIPEEVIYSLVAAIATVMVLFALWQTTYKYPKFIREVRALKSQVKKGKTPTVELSGRDVSKTFTQAYLAESKGALTNAQQGVLKEQHIKTGKSEPGKREVSEITAPPPPESNEPEVAPAPPVSTPPQEPAKPVAEVPKPQVVPTTPAPAPVPAKPAVPKPGSPPIAPIPERFLELIKAKQQPAAVKPPIPQVKTLPTVKSLPQVKELPPKPATKPAPKSEEKPEEAAGEEKKE